MTTHATRIPDQIIAAVIGFVAFLGVAFLGYTVYLLALDLGDMLVDAAHRKPTETWLAVTVAQTGLVLLGVAALQGMISSRMRRHMTREINELRELVNLNGSRSFSFGDCPATNLNESARSVGSFSFDQTAAELAAIRIEAELSAIRASQAQTAADIAGMVNDLEQVHDMLLIGDREEDGGGGDAEAERAGGTD